MIARTSPEARLIRMICSRAIMLVKNAKKEAGRIRLP